MDKLCNLLGKSLFKKVQEKLNGETLYLVNYTMTKFEGGMCPYGYGI